MKTELPPDLTPINLKAYFYNALFACGCSELDEMHAEILLLLEWHSQDLEARKPYNELYERVGVFYILSGLLSDLELAEHGTSIRFPWLTEDGERLLAALRKIGTEEIHFASGEAYDGCFY